MGGGAAQRQAGGTMLDSNTVSGGSGRVKEIFMVKKKENGREAARRLE